MVEIIPAIIPDTFEDIEDKMGRIEGFVARVQIDIIDGQFASAETWPFSDAQFQDIRGLPFIDELIIQIDMMVVDPEDYIVELINIGAKEFIIHHGSTENIEKCFEIIKSAEKNIGLAFRPSQNIEGLEHLIKLCDFVQFMGSDNIGHSGEELDQNIYEKIKNFRQKYPDMLLQIDIGVNPETAPRLVEAGATALVSGSAIFKSVNIEEAIRKLQLT